MSNVEYGPQYFVRILTSNGEVNLNNVISISTSKDVNGDTGSFEIMLDYNQMVLNQKSDSFGAAIYRQDSIFFQVKPMDYIEIYLARSPKVIGKNLGFGVYGSDGYFIRNFDEMIDNDGNRVELDKTKTEALNIVERITNPHLIFCGYVDGITNSFAPSESGTNNAITIRGKCLAKFLSVHYLYFNFPYSNIFLKQVDAMFSLNGLRAHEAVDMVLTRFCIDIFTRNVLKKNLSEYGKIPFKDIPKSSFPDDVIIYNDLNTGEFNEKVIHNNVPSFKYLYWATNLDSASKYVPQAELTSENGYYPWGRMEYANTVNRSILNINSESPVLSILKQGAQMPFNEFFIDEIGNIVLRKTLDAWDYNSGIDESNEIINDPSKMTKEWVEIKQEDIRSWNFQLSDDELKTVVIDRPVASVIGCAPIMLGNVGVAPVSRTNVEALLGAEKKKTYDEKTIKQISTAQVDLEKTFATIRSQQSYHLDEYNLDTDSGILKFWGRFGLRPVTIDDIYSDTFSRFYESAWAMFQKFANYWWSGSIIVKGDSKYKIGQKGKIKDFALDTQNKLRNFNCYIQGVVHNYAWGNDWTTTLKFTRGEIEGTFTSQMLSPVTKQEQTSGEAQYGQAKEKSLTKQEKDAKRLEKAVYTRETVSQNPTQVTLRNRATYLSNNFNNLTPAELQEYANILVTLHPKTKDQLTEAIKYNGFDLDSINTDNINVSVSHLPDGSDKTYLYFRDPSTIFYYNVFYGWNNTQHKTKITRIEIVFAGRVSTSQTGQTVLIPDAYIIWDNTMTDVSCQFANGTTIVRHAGVIEDYLPLFSVEDPLISFEATLELEVAQFVLAYIDGRTSI